LQHALALVRGPFLEGFWLREESGFDHWVQQQQWQVRLHHLFERLSSWQESGGELEPARATLMRWLTLDALSEEASRRPMRVDLALGDASAAWQVYATLRARLAEELRVQPRWRPWPWRTRCAPARRPAEGAALPVARPWRAGHPAS